MDIVQERLQREYDLNLILTTPNVQFLVHKRDGETLRLESPAGLPDNAQISINASSAATRVAANKPASA